MADLQSKPVNVDRINHATNNHQRIRLHGQYLPVNEYITLRRNGHPMTIVLSPFKPHQMISIGYNVAN